MGEIYMSCCDGLWRASPCRSRPVGAKKISVSCVYTALALELLQRSGSSFRGSRFNGRKTRGSGVGYLPFGPIPESSQPAYRVGRSYPLAP